MSEHTDTTGPPTAPPIVVSDQELALTLLTEKTGDVAEAAKILVRDNPDLRGAIKTRRETLQAEAQREVDAEWQASPAGKLARAEQLAAAREERTKLARLARTALEEDETLDTNLSRRLEMVAALSDEEAITYAGLETKPEEDRYQLPAKTEYDVEAERLAQSWWNLSEGQRVEECQRIAGADAGKLWAQIQAHKEANPNQLY